MTQKLLAGANGRRHQRRGTAALEMAITLPVLVLITVIAVDYARLFYHYNTITNCARNGAMYASDAYSPLRNRFASYQDAALADGQSLSPPLTADLITMTSGTDAGGDYVEVTVDYQFPMVTSYLGFGTVELKRSVRMRVAPAVPDTPP